jgi:CDP-diacylglycerol--glycerol-3-phosphate 3-phosphatidyltransferase
VTEQELEAEKIIIKPQDHFWKNFIEMLPKGLTPNHLSGVRLIMAAPIILLILTHFYKIAGGLFLFAAVLDGLDGSLARVRNQVTKFGAFLDPLADKVVNLTAFIGFLYVTKSSYYLYLVVAIILIDLFLFFLATTKYLIGRYPNGFLSKKYHVTKAGANKFGKIKMVLQVIVLSFLMIFDPTTSFAIHERYSFLPHHLSLIDASLPLLIACLVFALLSVRGHLAAINIKEGSP